MPLPFSWIDAFTDRPFAGNPAGVVPYWAARLGRAQLHARQVSARGGELWCELVPATGSRQAGDRVRMAGHAVSYLRGQINI